MKDGVLTMGQAAQVARITVGNLRTWIKRGKLKATKPDGLHWAILETDLMEAIAENPPGVLRGVKRTDGDRARKAAESRKGK